MSQLCFVTTPFFDDGLSSHNPLSWLVKGIFQRLNLYDMFKVFEHQCCSLNID